MAISTPVNGRITDAVTQSNEMVLGSSPTVSMGTLYQGMAHAAGLSFHNSVQAQRHMGIAAQAAMNQGVNQVFSTGSTANAVATSRIARGAAGAQGDSLAVLLLALALAK